MQIIDPKDYAATQRNARPLDPHERAAAGDSEDDREPMTTGDKVLFVAVCFLSCWAAVSLVLVVVKAAS
jgi:hypothetical protein